MYYHAYGVNKSPKAVTKRYFHNSCIRIRVLIYYDFGSRNRISLTRTPVLLTQQCEENHICTSS